jgi:protein TonB
LVGPISQARADAWQAAKPPGKPTPATRDALLNQLVSFFDEAAKSPSGHVSFDRTYDAFSEMLDRAKEALAEKRIDQRFCDRYERLLRVATLAIIPDKAGLLLPVITPEIAAFVHDVTGSKLAEGSGSIGQTSAAISTEIQSLRKYQVPKPLATGNEVPKPLATGDQAPKPLATGVSAREDSLKRKVAASPADPQAAFDLAKLQEDAGAVADAEATLLKAQRALPTNTDVPIQLAYFYNRRGQFEKTMTMLQTASRIDPRDAEIDHMIASFYYDKISHDASLGPVQRGTYIREGIAAADRALAIEPDYMEALVYKGLLLRKRAEAVTDTAQKTRILAEADLLKARAAASRGKPQAVHHPRMSAAASPEAPVLAFVTPPPPPPSGTQMPVSVGGDIKPPVRITNVPPEYPADALAARIQGLVIVEATIDADGHVANAKVVRSVPLLDQAALDAVRQWVYQPTLLEGRAVPVIMRVTVNFSLK